MQSFILVRVEVPDHVLLRLLRMIIQMGTLQNIDGQQSHHPGLSRVELIRFLRSEMKCGLKEATDYVDDLIEHLRRGIEFKSGI